MEINLIPWRLRAQKKQQRYFYCFSALAVILMVIFILMHFFIASKNNKISMQVKELNQLLALQLNAHSKGDGEQAFDILTNDLQKFVEFIYCLGFYPIQIEKAEYSAERIDIAGKISSPESLAKIISACHFTYQVKRNVITSLRNSDMFRFLINLNL